MIRAAGWYCSEHCGVYAPRGGSFQQSPAGECLELVGKPVKYYSRMTDEARFILCAASLASRGADWAAGREIGMLGCGANGFVRANQEFYRDYVANGRSLGRGNLFIYTLPTSALGETAIVLGLSGPCMYLEQDSEPLESMVRRAERFCEDGEAEGMLVLWSDTQAAVCLAVDASEGTFAAISGKSNPLELSAALRSIVERA
jgi:hypothetical protein